MRDVAAEEAAEFEAAEAAVLAENHAELEEKTDEEICEELGLPDPDSLVEGDDAAAFMAKAVPDRIRRRALRQLWRVNPVLANLDGLVDYGEDYTDAATVIENMQTAYQVGKGMLKHVEEMARQAAEAEAKEAEEALAMSQEPADEPQNTLVEPAAEDAADIEAEPFEHAFTDIESAEADPSEYAPAPRRRMAFTFPEDSPEVSI